MPNAALLLSGGIDSMVCLSLLLRAGHSVETVHVDYGQGAAAPEIEAARRISASFEVPCRVVKVDFGRTFGAGEIPFRNVLLISIAAASARKRVDEVVIGIHAGTPYPDCSDEFLKSVNNTMWASSNDKLSVVTPLKTWRKAEIIAFSVKEQLPLQLTYSCEKGEIPPCGRCLSCMDRSALPC